jgi:K+/H+ antiporter YhaU regulatory subunit KhtT
MIPVNGHKNLYRDEDSGAIINHDNEGYSQYVHLRDSKKSQKEELDRMREDIDEIKSLLKELVKNPN